MFSVKLKQLRKERGLLQKDISQIFNVSMGAVGNWESGNRIPDSETLSRIADYFRVSVDYLLGRTDDLTSDGETLLPGLYPVTKKKFPVLGKVSCGEPVYTEEDRETSIMASADIDADFCLVAKGDSMTGASIEDGDIVFIKKMEIVPNNYIGVVLVGDEATLKYVDWRPESSTLILTPANPAYRTQIYQGADLDQIRIIGLAVTLQKSLVHRIK